MQVSLPLTPTRDDLAHFDVSGRGLSEEVKNRQLIERAIVRRACADLIEAGYHLRVNYGEGDFGCNRTNNLDNIMCAIQACDEEWIDVYMPVPEAGWRRVSQMFLVYGNDGWDVIADHGVFIEHELRGATELSEAIEEATPLTPAQQAHVDFINAQRQRH